MGFYLQKENYIITLDTFVHAVPFSTRGISWVKNGAFSVTFFVICLDLNYLLYLCSYHSKNGKQNLASAS